MLIMRTWSEFSTVRVIGYINSTDLFCMLFVVVFLSITYTYILRLGPIILINNNHQFRHCDCCCCDCHCELHGHKTILSYPTTESTPLLPS